jgi:hypothetical protein
MIMRIPKDQATTRTINSYEDKPESRPLKMLDLNLIGIIECCIFDMMIGSLSADIQMEGIVNMK